MYENEKTIVPEFNPYDQLIEQGNEPVKSPVILGTAGRPEKKMQAEKTVEIIPLASEAIYKKLSLKECKTIDVQSFELEEDILVPDTFPDMEMILNMDAVVLPIEINSGSSNAEINGTIKLETMYRSDETYGNNLSLLPYDMKFSKDIKSEHPLIVNIQIMKTDFRIINERKYRVKIYLTMNIKKDNESEKLIFEGIANENLYLHKENRKMLNLVSRKTKESDINEELLINDEKIRPVKILKSKTVIAENHRQLTKEKLVLNQTIWVRVMYLAEIASKGNLSNQPMFFQGKIDHTQFIALGKSDEGTEICTAGSDTSNIKVEINRESNGFEVSGDLMTEVVCYRIVENEIVTDFYHDKEEMTCDSKPEIICSDMKCVLVEQTVRESINLQQESGEELRIVYSDACIIDPVVSIENESVVVKGKLHLETVVINEGDYTILAKKICDFSCVKELEYGTNVRAELERIIVREMKCEISGNSINIAAQVHASLNIYNDTEISLISNPCIIRSGEPAKIYPITIHTVIEGETVWDIGKKYKVSEERIKHYNKEESIRAGQKIIIVK